MMTSLTEPMLATEKKRQQVPSGFYHTLTNTSVWFMEQTRLGRSLHPFLAQKCTRKPGKAGRAIGNHTIWPEIGSITHNYCDHPKPMCAKLMAREPLVRAAQMGVIVLLKCEIFFLDALKLKKKAKF